MHYDLNKFLEKNTMDVLFLQLVHHVYHKEQETNEVKITNFYQ